jgi:hypothetical protein
MSFARQKTWLYLHGGGFRVDDVVVGPHGHHEGVGFGQVIVQSVLEGVGDELWRKK